MIISWKGRDATGRYSISAEPENYDAVPAINTLYLDRDMPVINNDSFGIASILMFGAHCAGSVTLPREVSPEAAMAIEKFLFPNSVRISNIQYEPFAIPQGDGFVYLDTKNLREAPLPNLVGEHRFSRVSVLNSTQYTGSLASMDGLEVASNAALLGKISGQPEFFAPLGVAILFAESFRARSVVLDDELLEDINVRRELSALLSGCKMVLQTVSEVRAFRE